MSRAVFPGDTTLRFGLRLPLFIAYHFVLAHFTHSSCISRITYCFQSSHESLRTMSFIAALAFSLVRRSDPWRARLTAQTGAPVRERPAVRER